MISETLMLAVGFNILLLLVAYFSGYRALLIASSVVWVIIDILIYQELEDKLILGILFLVAAGQAFLPLKGEASPFSNRRR